MIYNQLDMFGTPSAKNNDYHKSASQSFKKLALSNADITFYPDFFSREESNFFLKELMEKIQWQQDYIKLYGRQIAIPRQTAWYGDNGKFYTYSGIKMSPHPWLETLLEIKQRIELLAKVNFNSVLLNLYRDGKDSVAWHSDDEPELGKNPIIGSVSFGGERRFLLKPKDNSLQEKSELLLNHGSFLLMAGETQKHWLHQVPKTSKIVKPRVNLTFRIIN